MGDASLEIVVEEPCHQRMAEPLSASVGKHGEIGNPSGIVTCVNAPNIADDLIVLKCSIEADGRIFEQMLGKDLSASA